MDTLPSTGRRAIGNVMMRDGHVGLTGHERPGEDDSNRPDAPELAERQARAAVDHAWWTGTAAVALLLLLAIGLRAGAFSVDRDLWIDESMLALNIVERSPGRLLEPLDHHQAAPPAFLLLTKAATLWFGTSEMALRAVPFVGSVLGLLAFAWVAHQLLPRPAAVIGMALMAFSPFLISYAAEVKQYATDAALTSMLFAAAAGLLLGRGGMLRWSGLAAAGATAVWFSHPSVFVLGGIGTALAADAVWKKDRVRLLAALGAIAVWLVSWTACFYWVTLEQLKNRVLLEYWAGHFLPLPPAGLGDLAWVANHLLTPFANPAGLPGSEIRTGGVAAAFFFIGVGGMWRQRWPLVVAILVPIVLVLLASGLHKYPFAGRMLLFLIPLLVLGVARGMWTVGNALRRTQPVATALLAAVLSAGACLEAAAAIWRPERYEQLNDVLSAVRPRWQPGDRAYVYYGAAPAFTFYTRDNPLPADAVTFGVRSRDLHHRYREDLARFRGSARVWLFFSHVTGDEESVISAYGDSLGRCGRVAQAPGAAAYLCDFTAVSPGG